MGILSAVGTTVRAVCFTTRVAVGAVQAALNGAAEVLGTTADALQAVNRGDWDGLEKLADRKIEQFGMSIDNRLRAADELVDELSSCASDPKRRFFTPENAARTAAVLTTAAGAVAGISLLEDEGAEPSSAAGMTGADSFGAPDLNIANGVFEGDAEELDRLIQYGELEQTEHLTADAVERDGAARDAFLSMHGFSGVPDGMEVHHVVPLCEGGDDHPSNMVLVTEAQHDAITAAHSRFYGWR